MMTENDLTPDFVSWKPDCCEGCKFDNPKYLTVACTYPGKLTIDNGKCQNRQDIEKRTNGEETR